MNGYIFFIFISLIFSLLYLFVKNRNPSYTKAHSLIATILLVGLTIEVIGEITASYGYNNSLFYNLLFVYAETCLFYYFFYIISDSEKAKRNILILMVLFILFGLACSLFFQPLHLAFHNYSYAIGSLALIVLAIKFFLDVFNLNQYEDQNLLSIPYFWIVTVVLFFYSATFFYFTPLRLLYDIEANLIEPLHLIIRFLAGLLYVVLGIAFYAPFVFRQKY